MASSGSRVVVLGAGVNGLSTAVRLQQILPNVQVDIIASQFHRETTSCVAAGVYRMEAHAEPDGLVERVKHWSALSAEYFFALAQSSKSLESGVALSPLIHLLRKAESRQDGLLSRPLYLDYTLGARELSQNEVAYYGKGKYEIGFAATTVICEGEYYLPYLTQQFKEAGGRILQRNLSTLSEFLAENDKQYAVVINCLGFGAREFVPDAAVYAARGQVDRVRASWIKQGIYADDDIYVYPGREFVVLGGVRQKGNESLAVDAADAEHIRSRAEELVPALRGAELVRTDVGIRPCRQGGVRLEAEKHGSVTVVHNYGHGGHGVTLSWGCAVDAAQLAADALS